MRTVDRLCATALALMVSCTGGSPRKRSSAEPTDTASANSGGMGSVTCGVDEQKRRYCSVVGELSPFVLNELHKPGALGDSTLVLQDDLASEANLSRLSELGTELRSLHLKFGKGKTPSLESVAQLTSLTHLDLDYRSETYGSVKVGKTLQSVAALTALKELQISSADLSDLSFLGKLTQLEKLNLSSCALRDVSGLGTLVQLESLRLDSVREAAWPSLVELRSLSALQKISLSTDAKHCDAGWVGDLPNLESFSISSYRCDDAFDLSPLSRLGKLAYVRLGGVNVKSYAPLAAATALKEISAESTDGFPELAALAAAPALEKAYFGDSNLKDLSFVSALTQLVHLTIYSTQTPAHLAPLGNLTRLQTLDLAISPKTGAAPVNDLSFVDRIPGLKSLVVRSSLVVAASIQQLRQKNPALSVEVK